MYDSAPVAPPTIAPILYPSLAERVADLTASFESPASTHVMIPVIASDAEASIAAPTTAPLVEKVNRDDAGWRTATAQGVSSAICVEPT